MINQPARLRMCAIGLEVPTSLITLTAAVWCWPCHQCILQHTTASSNSVGRQVGNSTTAAVLQDGNFAVHTAKQDGDTVTEPPCL